MTISRIQHRRDTAANWTAANPVLATGEPAVETDTDRTKLGDGTTAWVSLPYLDDVIGVAVAASAPVAAAVGGASASATAAGVSATAAAGSASSAATSAGQALSAVLVEDPENPGLYFVPTGSILTPDPDYPGFYLIGS